jgi:hypothetical protein
MHKILKKLCWTKEAGDMMDVDPMFLCHEAKEAN